MLNKPGFTLTSVGWNINYWQCLLLYSSNCGVAELEVGTTICNLLSDYAWAMSLNAQDEEEATRFHVLMYYIACAHHDVIDYMSCLKASFFLISQCRKVAIFKCIAFFATWGSRLWAFLWILPPSHPWSLCYPVGVCKGTLVHLPVWYLGHIHTTLSPSSQYKCSVQHFCCASEEDSIHSECNSIYHGWLLHRSLCCSNGWGDWGFMNVVGRWLEMDLLNRKGLISADAGLHWRAIYIAVFHAEVARELTSLVVNSYRNLVVGSVDQAIMILWSNESLVAVVGPEGGGGSMRW